MYCEAIHELKTWPAYFDQVESGVKQFELRKNDREFHVGDLLILRKYVPDEDRYTGDVLCAVVTCVVRGEPWLAPGYVALGVRLLK